MRASDVISGRAGVLAPARALVFLVSNLCQLLLIGLLLLLAAGLAGWKLLSLRRQNPPKTAAVGERPALQSRQR